MGDSRQCYNLSAAYTENISAIAADMASAMMSSRLSVVGAFSMEQFITVMIEEVEAEFHVSCKT
jgi:hypothetical protein